MKEYNMTEDLAENRSVWHMKVNSGQLIGEKGEEGWTSNILSLHKPLCGGRVGCFKVVKHCY